MGTPPRAFLYTTNNNVFTTSSSNGSGAWTEAVLNVSSQPQPKLSFAIQTRYFLLGNYGNTIALDYAVGDYKVNDHFGVRFGKVKTPSGLFNEMQDVDPAYMWSLLPQSLYSITSRNSQLSHYGGVVYGSVKLGTRLGRLDYRGWGGEQHLSGDDGYFMNSTEVGSLLPNGLSTPTYGAALHWRTPVTGLMAGISYARENASSSLTTAGPFTGNLLFTAFQRPSYFAQYEKGKLMVAAEDNRLPTQGTVALNGLPPIPLNIDKQGWYLMATYKVTEQLTVGAYDSQIFDRAVPLGAARYSKDWVVSSRFDPSQYLYMKLEEHFLDGTQNDYDVTMNPSGLKPNTKLTILKAGVSF